MTKILFQEFQRELQVHGNDLRQAVDRVFRSSSFILGSEVQKFEKIFSHYIGVKHTIGVANGLEALQISFMALNIGPGDEVITTPFSAVATTLAIIAVGATPVFADVTDNGLIDPKKIERLITLKTKALLPVHLYGQAADIDELQRICRKHHLILIEDAAQAHGTLYKGKKVGSFGKINCFSFYPTKNLGAVGDGGAIVTNDRRLAQVCREIRDYGQRHKYIHIRYGLNSRLDELQAALLSEKLKYLDGDNRQRQHHAKIYLKLLADLPQLKIIQPLSTSQSVYHLFVIRTKKRNQLQKYLAEQGIVSLIHYPLTIPDQPFLKVQFEKANIPEARRMAKEVLSLPCHPYLTSPEIMKVSQTIHDFFQS